MPILKEAGPSGALPGNTGIVPPHLRQEESPTVRQESSTVPTAPTVRQEVLERIVQYESLLREAAGPSAAELAGLMAAESEGKADSGKGTPGYKGLLQAERTDDQLDPRTSILAGAKKLQKFKPVILRSARQAGLDVDAMERWDTFRLVLRGYNAGPAVVATALGYAKEAGDVRQWIAEEHYARALVHHGSYSTRHYAPKGAKPATLASAEVWRGRLKGRHLTLEDMQAEVATAIPEVQDTILRAVREKARRTPAYIEKAVAYAQAFAKR